MVKPVFRYSYSTVLRAPNCYSGDWPFKSSKPCPFPAINGSCHRA